MAYCTNKVKGDTVNDLTGWERRYLIRWANRHYIRMPRSSPVTDKLLARGILTGFGFVCGRYVDYTKTAYGDLVSRNLVTAP